MILKAGRALRLVLVSGPCIGYVYQDGKARIFSIEAGHTDGRLTEIISGLNAGDKVLLHPPDSVKDGSSVYERD